MVSRLVVLSTWRPLDPDDVGEQTAGTRKLSSVHEWPKVGRRRREAAGGGLPAGAFRGGVQIACRPGLDQSPHFAMLRGRR
jgi:hypothetical protein